MAATHLLKISPKEHVPAPVPRVRPVVDLFFLVAVAAGFIGTVGFGGYLWLARSGLLVPQVSYHLMRELHIFVQLYLLFGVAVCGFIIQSAPRVLNIGPPISLSVTSVILIAPLLGVSLKVVGFSGVVPSALMALLPLVTCVLLIIRQKWRAVRPHSLFIIIALSSMGVSVFADYNYPQTAFLAFWLAIGGALLGTSHIFIANLLGGKQLGTKTLFACLGTFLVGSLLIMLKFTTVGIFLNLLLVMFYVLRTRVFGTSTGPILVRIGFKLGYFWCLVGWGVLALNAGAWDQAFHVLATGWGVTILFVLSLHITGFISSFRGNDRVLNFTALMLWQVVPVTRGLLPLQYSSGAIVGIGGALVLMAIWLLSLWKRRYAHE